MKANQKFLNSDDDAVSPVIAVILMVAITVVLAATVYVWVSGFGAQSGNPQKSISLTSAGALASGGAKAYTVASGTSGMKYGDISISVNGANIPLADSSDAAHTPTTGCAGTPPQAKATNFLPCQGTSAAAASSVVKAGDVLYFYGLNSGDTLRILDSQANAVILTLTVG